MLSILLISRPPKLVLSLVGFENPDRGMSHLELGFDSGLDFHCSYPGSDFALDLGFGFGLKSRLDLKFALDLDWSFDSALLEPDFELGN